MTAAHTPGPWSHDDFEWSPEIHVRSAARHWSVCAVHEMRGCTEPAKDISRAETEANARLIASAPDLLASNIELRARLMAFVGAVAEMTDCGPDVDAIVRADAAIAKATGQ